MLRVKQKKEPLCNNKNYKIPNKNMIHMLKTIKLQETVKDPINVDKELLPNRHYF